MRLDEIPWNDKPTFDLLSRGDTHGIFQVSSPMMKGLLRTIKPSSLDDVSAVLALGRPGPLDAGFHTDFARKKESGNHRPQIHSELNEPLDEILAPTYGALVYQEQVMSVARILANYTLAQADNLRRAMGKKKAEVLEREFVPFRDGMRANGYSDDAVRAIWEILVPFSDYAFNLSHSMGYAYLTYRGAFLKANRPVEYMAALLTRSKNIEEITQDLAECRRMGLQLHPPDLNVSKVRFEPENGGIRYGLASIKGIGEEAARRVVNERPFHSVHDYFQRSHTDLLKTNVLETLIKSGCFDTVWPCREELLEEAPRLSRLATRHRKEWDHFCQPTILPAHYAPQETGQTEKDRGRRVADERELLGAEFSVGRIILNLSRPLNPDEWSWLKRVLENQPRVQGVVARIGGVFFAVGHYSSYTDRLAEHVAGLGIRMVEE